MIISITGTGVRNVKKLDEAARFLASHLLHPRTVAKIELDIDVFKTLSNEGECVKEDDHKNPRYFTINLQRAPIENMIKALCHEMVHVKQYAKNELGKDYFVVRRGKGPQLVTRWQGELWFPKKKEDEYWDSPWEIEAYGREVGLYQKWVHHNNAVKKKGVKNEKVC
jgi:hypothetical protein